MIRRCEIYWADIDSAFPHPMLVISKEPLNRRDSVVAATITSAKFDSRARLSHCVTIPADEFGLTKDCVIRAETVGPVATTHLDLDSGPIGRLDDLAFRDLVRALGVDFDSECMPC